MLKWFDGKKEIIVELAGGASLLLASAGVAPKAVAVLDAVAEAARAGDVRVALPAFVTGIVALARAAWRHRINRLERSSRPAPVR